MTETFAEVSPAVVAAHDAETLRGEVLRRMEVYVLELLHTLLSLPIKRVLPNKDMVVAVQGGTLDSLRRHTRCVAVAVRQASTAARNDAISATPACVTPRECMQAKASVSDHGGAACSAGYGQPSTSRRTLHSARHHLLLLSVLYRNVVHGDVATQRDVYYHLVRHVPAQEVVNRTVQQLSRVLRLPRQMMGVVAGGRGYIAGCLSYRGVSLQRTCTGLAAGEGMPIPLLTADLVVSVRGSVACPAAGNDGCVFSRPLPRSTSLRAPVPSMLGCSPSTPLSELADESATHSAVRGFQVPPNVCAIVVVEKHAVFTQLLLEGLPQLLPCVLLTAQGFPTHTARRLLSNLHAALPRAPVVGLVDYNPHGLAILAAYRWAATHDAPLAGSACMERFHDAVPALRWLGVRTTHIAPMIEAGGMGCANTGRSLVGQHPRLHSYTPALSQQGFKSCRDADVSSGACCSDGGAAVGAPRCASTVPDAARDAMSASPLTRAASFQGFTHRDTVVMGHQIKRLEGLLDFSLVPPTSRQSIGTDLRAADARGDDDVERRDATSAERIAAKLGAAEEIYPCLSVTDAAHQRDRVSVAAWLREAREMQRHKLKCEIEVLYTSPYENISNAACSVPVPQFWGQPLPSRFAEWVCQQLLRRQYI